MSRPDIKAAWEKQGAEPVTMTQPQFKAFMDAQIAKWADVIKANDIKPINEQRDASHVFVLWIARILSSTRAVESECAG